jgi:hypothetical protein
LPPALAGGKKDEYVFIGFSQKFIQESFRLKPIPFSPIREWAKAQSY